MCKPAQDGRILATDGVITNLFQWPKINGFHQGYFTPVSGVMGPYGDGARFVEVFSTFSSFSTRHRKLLLQWRGFSRRSWGVESRIQPQIQWSSTHKFANKCKTMNLGDTKTLKLFVVFFCEGKTWCFARIWRSAGFLPPNKIAVVLLPSCSTTIEAIQIQTLFCIFLLFISLGTKISCRRVMLIFLSPNQGVNTSRCHDPKWTGWNLICSLGFLISKEKSYELLGVPMPQLLQQMFADGWTYTQSYTYPIESMSGIFMYI